MEKELPEDNGVAVEAGCVDLGVDLLGGFKGAALAQQ